jgi:hypothetical protein
MSRFAVSGLIWGALVAGCGPAPPPTHLNVPAQDFVQLRWQAVLDAYGGYFIRDFPDGTQEPHWKVPPGKLFVITDYSDRTGAPA